MQATIAKAEKAEAQRVEQAKVDLQFYRDPIRDFADEQKEKDKIALQKRLDIANQFQIPHDYTALDLQARAKRAMTQPGVMAKKAPDDPLGLLGYTVTRYDPYKVSSPTGTISTNPVGGLDQFAKEVEFMEANYPNQMIGVEDMPGTLRDFYTNKQPVPAGSKFEVVPDDITFRSAPSTGPLRTRIQDERAEDIRKRALGNIALQTDKSLTDISDPQRRGIMGTVKDKSVQMAKDFATRKVMKALGLSALNPFLGVGSWLLDKFAPGTKAKFASKFKVPGTGTQKEATKKLVKHEPVDKDGINIAKQVSGGENVIAKTANQFAGTEVEGQIQSLVQNNLNLALRHYADMYSRIEKGYSPNRQEMDVFKLLEYYLNEAAPKPQGAAYGGRIDKPLTGRSRDI